MTNTSAAPRAPKPISSIAREIGLSDDDFEPYGRFKAKIEAGFLWRSLSREPAGKLVLVTAVSPTPTGIGKTTTAIGLGDALNRLGKRTAICLREPSLGPCFGTKGGATGGGLSQIVPADDINLHLTGDIHAVGSANNLLAALLDNHVYWGNSLDIDPDQVMWRRALDIPDRSLRDIQLVASPSDGFRSRGFDLTAASEVMAILCLANSWRDLERRLSNAVVAYDRSGTPITARDLGAHRPMKALLKDAVRPNLVQTLEGNPVLVHGGSFANVAHGCSSVIATRLGLTLADYVVTEAGSGSDLGAEKFFNIKCRQSGLKPAVAVVVTTVHALKFHGGVRNKELAVPNPKAVQRGTQNLLQHIWRIRKFGVSTVVAINHYPSDTTEEVEIIQRACETFGVTAVISRHWIEGGVGGEALAQAVVLTAERTPSEFILLYPDEWPLFQKIETVAREIHGANRVRLSDEAAAQLENLETLGYGRLPVCIAKTQYADPTGRDPEALDVREVWLAAGAEFVVAVCGPVMTMPGLPRRPPALDVRVTEWGSVAGPSW